MPTRLEALTEAASRLVELVRTKCDWKSVADQHPNEVTAGQAQDMVDALERVEALL